MSRRLDQPHLVAFGRWSGGGPPGLPHGPRPDAVWEPPTDVFIVEGTVVIRMELAGVAAEAITLTVEGRFVRVAGERPRPECGGEPGEFRQAEISYGPFQRAFEFPETLDSADLKAQCKDGFLTIEVRPANSKLRRIAIEPAE
jgi:HSP20 family protein